ncbi:MAG: hypothetical protein EPN84_06360 [Legionella sp.]|nr:MAG: hypothetical protein EPN84_06360 [Legionella sp.]
MSKIHNPVSGACAVSLSTAIIVSIGAAILQDNVHDNTVTVLAGGAITGAIAGVFAMCIPEAGKDASSCLKVGTAGLHSALVLAAKLTSPLMGEQLLHYGTSWGEVALDGLVGTGVLLGVGVGCAALTGTALCITGCSFFGRDLRAMGRALFSSSSEASSPSPAV